MSSNPTNPANPTNSTDPASSRRSSRPVGRRSARQTPATQTRFDNSPTVPRRNELNVSQELFEALDAHSRGYRENVIQPGVVAKEDHLIEAGQYGLPPVVTYLVPAEWSFDLDARARRDWEATREEWSFRGGTADAYHKLYRSCLSQAGCTPADIVGVRNRFSFALDFIAHNRATYYAFSYLFCVRFDLLVTHPVWSFALPGDRAAALALAIQYATILRTNDRRRWEFQMSGSFMLHFQQLAQNGVCKKEAHAETRATFLAQDECPPILSNVFIALESVVNTPEHTTQLHEDDFYYVTVSDLTNLIAALDCMVDPDTQVRVFLSAEIYNKAAASMLPERVRPRNGKEAEEMHAEAMLEEKRRGIQQEMAMRRRLQSREPDPPSMSYHARPASSPSYAPNSERESS